MSRLAAAILALSVPAGIVSAEEPPTVDQKVQQIDQAFPTKYNSKGGMKNLTRDALVQGADPYAKLAAFLTQPGYVVLGVEATWCKPCRESYPRFASFAQRTDAAYGMFVIDEPLIGLEASDSLHRKFGGRLKTPSYYIFCNSVALAPPVHTVDALRSAIATVATAPCESQAEQR